MLLGEQMAVESSLHSLFMRIINNSIILDKKVKVVETKCYANGDNCCEYEATILSNQYDDNNGNNDNEND